MKMCLCLGSFLTSFSHNTASAAETLHPHMESSHVCTAIVRMAGKTHLRGEKEGWYARWRSYVCEALFWHFLLKMCQEDFQMGVDTLRYHGFNAHVVFHCMGRPEILKLFLVLIHLIFNSLFYTLLYFYKLYAKMKSCIELTTQTPLCLNWWQYCWDWTVSWASRNVYKVISESLNRHSKCGLEC